MKRLAALAALRRRKEAVLTEAASVQVDELVDRIRGRLGDLDRKVADYLRAANLAPDLVAILLVERGEVFVPVAARRGDDRTDVLLLARDLPRRIGRGQCRLEFAGSAGSAAAQPAQVDDVPRRVSVRGIGR